MAVETGESAARQLATFASWRIHLIPFCSCLNGEEYERREELP